MKLMRNIFLIIIFSFLYTIIFIKYDLIILSKIGIYHKIETDNNNIIDSNKEFISNCNCTKNDKIKLIKHETAQYTIYLNDNYYYNLTLHELHSSIFTCDLYKTFLRGKHQKVISYSLYGTNQFYYKNLKKISNIVKQKYPDWFIRIYHDDSINSSIICELECLNNNIDFCNINKLSIKNINFNYLHAMMWRWLPIGDQFVDVFSSRDLDSLIIQREIDSVNIWLLESNKVVHIMRDNKAHGTEILGGMWGFYNARNRILAFHLFNLILNSQRYNNVNSYKKKNLNGNDQLFLSDIYYLLKNEAIIHDSYFCEKYGGDPYPTERIGNCFIGAVGECNSTGLFEICPVKCRKYLEWITC